ncbi:MAG: FtsQ-type POTRA domain-containing protein [Acutalibacteraceae bacterium]
MDKDNKNNENIRGESREFKHGEHRRRTSRSRRYTNNKVNKDNKNNNTSKNQEYNSAKNVSNYSENIEKDNLFFSNSSVKSQVNVRTNRAEDFFENKDYKPWDNEDDFNKRNHTPRNTSTAPKIRKKATQKGSKFRRLKNGVGRVSKSVLTSNGEDENTFLLDENDGLTTGLKNNRNNKRLLDELNNNKKPLTKGQRKAKNMFVSGCIVLGALIFGIVLSLTVLFKCEQIEVVGVTRYAQQDIIKASNLNYGQNLFITNRDNASNSIEQKYPYIESADITFALPNKFIISVNEATPEYYIQSGTKFYITSKNSKLLEEVAKRELDIPTIKGCKLKNPKVGAEVNVENDKVTTVLSQVAQCVANNGVTGIKEIDLTDMSGIELNYQNRITIVIGMPEYIEYKFRTAMTIIYNKLSDTDIGKLDCSGLVKDRTDGKSNASYFRPNNLIVESTEPATEPTTEFPVEYATEPATEIETEDFTDYMEYQDSNVEYVEDYSEDYSYDYNDEYVDSQSAE